MRKERKRNGGNLFAIVRVALYCWRGVQLPLLHRTFIIVGFDAPTTSPRYYSLSVHMSSSSSSSSSSSFSFSSSSFLVFIFLLFRAYSISSLLHSFHPPHDLLSSLLFLSLSFLPSSPPFPLKFFLFLHLLLLLLLLFSLTLSFYLLVSPSALCIITLPCFALSILISHHPSSSSSSSTL